MKQRSHDLRRLDVEAFAVDAAALEGLWPLSALPRLHEVVPDDAPRVDADVQWSARGERRKPRAAEPETWLHLHAETAVWMECQRCLQPVHVPLDIDRSIRFVAGEDAAARLDAETEDDVLELSGSLDLQALLEDELLLALPLVPRHEQCALHAASVGEDDLRAQRPNPFASLAVLKRHNPQ